MTHSRPEHTTTAESPTSALLISSSIPTRWKRCSRHPCRLGGSGACPRPLPANRPLPPPNEAWHSERRGARLGDGIFGISINPNTQPWVGSHTNRFARPITAYHCTTIQPWPQHSLHAKPFVFPYADQVSLLPRILFCQPDN